MSAEKYDKYLKPHDPTEKERRDRWQRLLGVKGVAGVSDNPLTPLDHAMRWAAKGLYIFPAEQHLGTPLVDNWYTAALSGRNANGEPSPANIEKIISWWTENPSADIGAVPCRSGHFVLAVHGIEGGHASLDELERENGKLDGVEHDIWNRWNDRFLWIKGAAYTSHNKLGRGLHVLGQGMRTYLTPSFTPHLNYETGDE